MKKENIKDYLFELIYLKKLKSFSDLNQKEFDKCVSIMMDNEPSDSKLDFLLDTPLAYNLSGFVSKSLKSSENITLTGLLKSAARQYYMKDLEEIFDEVLEEYLNVKIEDISENRHYIGNLKHNLAEEIWNNHFSIKKG